jgi:hypothetical protein
MVKMMTFLSFFKSVMRKKVKRASLFNTFFWDAVSVLPVTPCDKYEIEDFDSRGAPRKHRFPEL